jgi:hypothetical protein
VIRIILVGPELDSVKTVGPLFPRGRDTRLVQRTPRNLNPPSLSCVMRKFDIARAVEHSTFRVADKGPKKLMRLPLWVMRRTTGAQERSLGCAADGACGRHRGQSNRSEHSQSALDGKVADSHEIPPLVVQGPGGDTRRAFLMGASKAYSRAGRCNLTRHRDVAGGPLAASGQLRAQTPREKLLRIRGAVSQKSARRPTGAGLDFH